MDSDYDTYEVVKVIPGFRLFDSRFNQRNYCTSHGEPLMPGYYVVSWPEVIQQRRFNEQAAFHGPFKYRKEAFTFLKAIYKHKYMLIMSLPNRPYKISGATRMEERKVA
jgi:hypothetical protein